MRIAVFTGVFPKASETFVLSQVLSLIDEGHDVHVFSAAPSEAEPRATLLASQKLEGRVHYYAQTWGDSLRLVSKKQLLAHPLEMTRLAQIGLIQSQGEFDLHYCHFGNEGLALARLKKLGLKGPLAVVFHGHDMTVFIREHGEGIYGELFEQAQSLLPVSEFWKQRLITLGAPADRIEVIHMGVNCLELPYRPRALAPDKRAQVISIGRFVEKKGFDYALAALAEVKQSDLLFDYHLVGDGPLRPEIEAAVHELGLKDCVTLHGWKSAEQVAELLAQSHIMLAPSVTAVGGDTEGIPVVLMEAMASGLPIVSSQHTGIPELVEHGKSGFLAPERDVTLLAEYLRTLIASPQLWGEMGRLGRARVETAFNSRGLQGQLSAALVGAAAANS